MASVLKAGLSRARKRSRRRRSLLLRKIYGKANNLPKVNHSSNNTTTMVHDVNSSPHHVSTISFDSPGDVFTSLIAPHSEEEFFQRYWEKEPLVIHRTGTEAGRTRLDYQQLFTLENLRSLVGNGVISYGRDVNVCRYVKGKRENLNSVGVASVKQLEQDFTRKKATFQVHQPQRFKVKSIICIYPYIYS